MVLSYNPFQFVSSKTECDFASKALHLWCCSNSSIRRSKSAKDEDCSTKPVSNGAPFFLDVKTSKNICAKSPVEYASKNYFKKPNTNQTLQGCQTNTSRSVIHRSSPLMPKCRLQVLFLLSLFLLEPCIEGSPKMCTPARSLLYIKNVYSTHLFIG